MLSFRGHSIKTFDYTQRKYDTSACHQMFNLFELALSFLRKTCENIDLQFEITRLQFLQHFPVYFHVVLGFWIFDKAFLLIG